MYGPIIHVNRNIVGVQVGISGHKHTYYTGSVWAMFFLVAAKWSGDSEMIIQGGLEKLVPATCIASIQALSIYIW